MKRMRSQEEDDLLQKYSHIVVNKIKEMKHTDSIKKLSIEKFNGMSPDHIKKFVRGDARLYTKHFFLFADGGVFKLRDLIGEKALGDMPKKEQIVLKKMFMKSEIAELIHFLEEQGVDVLEILRAHSKAVYSRKLK
ncbi:MAG: hypothetical protein ACQESF_02605 [Nanobdellota archaeon]